MEIKAMLIDFDGTIAQRDILDALCNALADKEELKKKEAEWKGNDKIGLALLCERINLLKGKSVEEINKVISEDLGLMPGAKKLFKYLENNNIISILLSGNIIQVLEYYQKELNINHVVGSTPRMNGNQIDKISIEDYPSKDFKVVGAKKILDELGIKKEETVAIGDSIVDKGFFELANYSITINPKYGIENYADKVIKDTLEEVPKILEEIK